MAFIISMLIIFLLVIICILFIMFIDWLVDYKPDPKIKFTEFFKLYNMNKYKWRLYDHYVEYKENEVVNRFGYPEYRSHFLSFGFFNYVIYRCWFECEKYHIKKNETKSKLDKFYSVVYEEHDNE